MKKRILVPLTVALLLTGALAQEAAVTPNLEIRLSIVESRLGRLESDVSRLSNVPEQLARIETSLASLTERSSGNSNVLQTLGLSVVTFLLGGGVSWLFRNKSS